MQLTLTANYQFFLIKYQKFDINLMVRSLYFVGTVLTDLQDFPSAPRREAGYQLNRVQSGLRPSDWKPMSTVGRGVREIRISSDGQFRVLYWVSHDDAVYVLHAFPKKSRKTRRQDIELARQRLKAIRQG